MAHGEQSASEQRGVKSAGWQQIDVKTNFDILFFWRYTPESPHEMPTLQQPDKEKQGKKMTRDHPKANRDPLFFVERVLHTTRKKQEQPKVLLRIVQVTILSLCASILFKILTS